MGDLSIVFVGEEIAFEREICFESGSLREMMQNVKREMMEYELFSKWVFERERDDDAERGERDDGS